MQTDSLLHRSLLNNMLNPKARLKITSKILPAKKILDFILYTKQNTCTYFKLFMIKYFIQTKLGQEQQQANKHRAYNKK